MTDVVDALLAKIEQIERVARDASVGPWRLERNEDDGGARTIAASGRTLDAIGKLRVMADYQRSAAAQILADALLLISRNGCSNYTRGSCRDYRHRTRGAVATADAWCGECVARDALERAGVRVEDGETK